MKNFRILLVISFIVLASLNSKGQWEQCNGPYGGDVHSLAVSSSNIFAGTDGGIFLSTNNGGSWVAKNNGLSGENINCIAVSGSNIFAGSLFNGVFLSTNNGTNWTEVNSGITNQTVRALAVSGSNIFAGTGGGIFLSTDNGENWTEVNNGLTNQTVYSLAVSGSDIFAGTNGGGVFLSTNNGANWTEVNNGITNQTVFSLAVSGSNIFAGTGGGIFLSTDNGENWTEVNNGLPQYYSISSIVANGSNIFLGTTNTNYGIFLSTNNGANWTEVNNGLTNQTVISFAVSGTDIFAGTYGGGVFKSTNNGANWAGANIGLTVIDVNSLAVSGTGIFAGTEGNGVFSSTNNGESWASVNTGLSNQHIDFITVNGTNIFAGASDEIFLSTNNGVSWAEVYDGGPYGYLVKCLIENGTNIFVGHYHGIILSTDNGDNWTDINDGLTEKDIASLAFRGTYIFAGTNGGGIFLSTNNGTNWSAINNGLTNQRVNSIIVSGTDIFAGTNGGGVFLSTNNGTNWSAINNGLSEKSIYSIAVSDTIIFAGTYRGIFLSTNKGADWRVVNTGLTNKSIIALSVLGKEVFAGTLGSSVFKANIDDLLEEGSRNRDSLALVALYNATDGPNWYNNENWITNEPIDNWYGVAVVNGRVDSLSLRRNDLFGEIPPELGNLTKLRYLSFHGNDANSKGLNGEIPPELGNLSNLTYLNLWGNRLTGEIPHELGNLSELIYLNLGFNYLSGEIPKELMNLTKLKYLLLGYNGGAGANNEIIGGFTGVIPSEIMNLKNLESLELAMNNFTGTIPSEIGQLSNLKILDLSWNKLTGTITPEIGNLSNLKRLSLEWNELNGELPVEISDLDSLTFLALGSNKLSGTIPKEYGDLTNLTSFYLASIFGDDGNQISGDIPEELKNLLNIKYIKFQDNQFTSCPDFSTLDSLKLLSIKDNKLDFDDIEPNMGIEDFEYSPQDSVGTEQDLAVTEGSEYTISVNVGGSNNKYQWFLNGSEITDAVNADYTIDAMSQDDEGSYVCRITNTVATELTLWSRPINVSMESKNDLIVNAGGDKEICFGNSVQIGNTSPASGGEEPYEFKWSPSTGLDNDAISNPTASPEQTTVYTLTVTDARDSAASAQVTVTVNPLPEPEISGKISVFSNEIASYSSNDAFSYKWYAEGGEIQGSDNAKEVSVKWGSGSSGILKLVQTTDKNCTDSMEAGVTIQTWQPSLVLEVVDKDFGEYPVHPELKLRSSVTIRNNGNSSVYLDSLASSNAEFQINEQIGAILPNRSVNAGVSFKPAQEGERTAVLTAYSGNEKAEGNLKGTGTAMPEDAAIAGMELSIIPNTGKPGDKVKLVLNLVGSENLTASARDFETTIGLNPYVLHYDNAYSSKHPPTTILAFDDRFENRPIEVRGTRRMGNDILVSIDFEVLLGTEDTTKILFKQSPVWKDADVPVYTILKDSIFVVDICRADGERLLKFKDDESFISSINPHPVKEEAEIKYYLSENTAASLYLISVLGEKKLIIFKKSLKKGFGASIFKTDNIPSGLYILIFKGADKVFDSKKVLIVR